MEDEWIAVRKAGLADIKFVDEIIVETEQSARARGTGIAKRNPESLIRCMCEGNGIIAITASGHWVGFAYITVWENGKFVSNSGLIVAPEFRHTGVASAIKQHVFALSREKYPLASVFSITTGIAVMKMNSRLGFEPVTFEEITHDPEFWAGCKSCVNYGLLVEKGYHNCLCTAMRFDPRSMEPCPDKKSMRVQVETNA